jgi:hypothetical protein
MTRRIESRKDPYPDLIIDPALSALIVAIMVKDDRTVLRRLANVHIPMIGVDV